MKAEKKKGLFGEHPTFEDVKITISGDYPSPETEFLGLQDYEQSFSIGVIFGLVGLVVVPFALAYGDHSMPGDPDSWWLLLLYYAVGAGLYLAYRRRQKRVQRRLETAPVGEPLNLVILAYLEGRYRSRSWILQITLSLMMVLMLLAIIGMLFTNHWIEGLPEWDGFKNLSIHLISFAFYVWILRYSIRAFRKNACLILLQNLSEFRQLNEKECAAALAQLLFHLRRNRVLDTAWERLMEPAHEHETGQMSREFSSGITQKDCVN